MALHIPPDTKNPLAKAFLAKQKANGYPPRKEQIAELKRLGVAVPTDAKGGPATKKDLAAAVEAARTKSQAVARAMTTRATADRAAARATALVPPAPPAPAPTAKHPAIVLADELAVAWSAYHGAEDSYTRNKIYQANRHLIDNTSRIRRNAAAAEFNQKSKS
jgi:hypothetical protein